MWRLSVALNGKRFCNYRYSTPVTFRWSRLAQPISVGRGHMNRDDIHEQAAAGRGNKESRPLRVKCSSTSWVRTDLNKVVAFLMRRSFVRLLHSLREYTLAARCHATFKSWRIVCDFFLTDGKKESWLRGSFVASLFSKRYRPWNDEVKLVALLFVFLQLQATKTQRICVNVNVNRVVLHPLSLLYCDNRETPVSKLSAACDGRAGTSLLNPLM